MPMLSAPVNIDRLVAAGEPHTTHAGRFAIPAALMDGEYQLLALKLVYDDAAAEQLYIALGEHLAGRGARPAPVPA
jgi:hypothetical protein